MSVSVGVVEFRYLDVPDFPVERFLRDLMIDPNAGMGENGDDENEDEYWDGGGGYRNAYYELSRGGLVKRANGWAAEEEVGATERATLLNWIENLPYQKSADTIMLHLSD